MNVNNLAVVSPEQWSFNNENLIKEVEDIRMNLEKVKDEAKLLAREKVNLAHLNQQATTINLAQQAKEAFKLRKHLEDEIASISVEISKMQSLRERLETVKFELELINIINQECFHLRQQRKTTELVHDLVQETLSSERSTVTKCLSVLEEKIRCVDIHLRKNSDIKSELERDWSDKDEGYNIDTSCGLITNNTQTEHFSFAMSPINNSGGERWNFPDQWIKATEKSLIKSMEQLETSKEERAMIDETIKIFAMELRSKADDVDICLVRRITEVESSSFQLKNQLKKVVDDIAKAEKTSNDILDARKSLSLGPLQVVQSRLTKRIQKPQRELLIDDAQNGLQSELCLLTESDESLMMQQEAIEKCLESLQMSRKRLQEEIDNKRNTIVIDKTRCQNTRGKYPSQTKLLGF